jgi:hypothetical protein
LCVDEDTNALVVVELNLDPPIRECGRCFPDAVRALSADARKE